MIKLGMVATLDELNDLFLTIYRNMNGVFPDKALTITSGQLYYYAPGDPNSGMQYPSMYGMQFLDNDDSGLVTADVIERIDSVL